MVALCCLLLLELEEGLDRHPPAKAPMAAHTIVNALPSQELPVKAGQRPGQVCHLMELFRKGAMSSLHVSAELGPPVWEHERAQAAPLAPRFGGGLELGAPSTWMARTGG